MMDQLRQLLQRLLSFFRDAQDDHDLDAEMAAHLELAIEENLQRALPPEEARRQALLRFGGAQQAKMQNRDARGLPFLETLLQDLRFGLRMLAKSPSFTAIAVLTLALGIGANTAIFTIFDAVLLQSLPVREPSRLVLFTDSLSEGSYSGDVPSNRWESFSTEVSDYLRKQPLPFESLAEVCSCEDAVTVRLAGATAANGPAERARTHLVSGNYFSTMGVDAFVGRMLSPNDDQPNAVPVVVASYGFWKRRLHGDAAVVGKTAYLNGMAFAIVGVAPAEFFGERIRQSPDFWVPLVFQPQIQLLPSNLERTDEYWLSLIGRVSAGATRAQAQAATTAALQQFLTNKEGSKLTEARGRTIARSHVEFVDGAGGISWLRFAYSKPLHILLAVVGMVLLIACANVGNLLLSRAAARQTEISVRLALGGSRFRLIRQLLTESILLASFGAACGLLLAHWAVNVLSALVAGNSPMRPHLNLTVLVFTTAIALLAGILFGLAPALSAGRTDLAASLNTAVRGMTANRKSVGGMQSLIAAQIAVSLVLLVGANLFVRSLLNLERQPLGFDQSHILLAGVSPRVANYTPENVAGFYRKLYERLNSLPGVQVATLARYSPMSGSSSTHNATVEGYADKPGENPSVESILVGPSYVETMGMTLLQGREIGLQDVLGKPKVAMVNEAFVRAYLPGKDPISHRFGFGKPPSEYYEIVGVLRDARFHDVKEQIKPIAFPAILQDATQAALSAGIMIRTAGDPAPMAATVRKALAEVDPNLPVGETRTLRNQIASTLDVERVATELVSFFGALALLLACVGLYGVVAQSVSRRTNEIGVRMALGAQRGDILWMILRSTVALLAVGLAIGIPVAFVATRLIKSQLFGVRTADALSFAFAALILAGVAILAGLLPARRAARVDPMVALRYE